jgi:hypothetical protein
MTGECIKTYKNIQGLFLEGCSFKELHPKSNLSYECKKALEAHGATI